MKKFRRSIMRNKSQEFRPEVVSVHLESASTVLDELRGQATWEEEWMDNNPGMVSATNHERKVHLLSDLLGQADGVVAFQEVMDSSPALRALMSTGSGSKYGAAEGTLGGGALGHVMAAEEAKYRLVQEKLDDGDAVAAAEAGVGGEGGAGARAQRANSTQEFYHHRDRLRSLLEQEYNGVCADCTSKLPTWASINNGVFLCTQCAGCHRSLGVHISKVLSVQLDDWTKEQVEFMAGMGNGMANSFLEYHVPSAWLKPSHLEPRDYRDAYIKAKYQDRLFEFRGPKKPVIKPPPVVDLFGAITRGANGDAGGGEELGRLQSHGMTEYVGFVNIVLVRGEDLVLAGFGQLQYMAVLRIGGQEVRSRWVKKSDGAPVWSEKLMLCWDGTMPLNIDVYGGKEHIGQAQVSLRKLLLKDAQEKAGGFGNSTRSVPSGESGSRGGGLKPESGLLDGVLASPSPAHGRGASFSANGAQPRQLFQVERLPESPSAVSNSSSEPPTLNALSSASAQVLPHGLKGATAITSAVTPRSPPNGISIVPSTKKTGAPSATPTAGSGADIGGGGEEGCTSVVTPLDSMDGDSVFGFSRSSFKGAATGSSKKLFVPPVPAVKRVRELSTPVEVLPGGELYIPLQDRKDSTTVDRYNNASEQSPVTGPGSVSSSRAASPRMGISNWAGIGGNPSGSGSSKSFNSMILKLGKGGGTLGGTLGSSGHSHSRPARGGVVIKMDFVRIEH